MIILISNYIICFIYIFRSEEEPNDDLYSFVTESNVAHTTVDSNIEEEIHNYLSSADTELKVLFKFPRLRHAFLKFNASLPSSAAVERLFSAAGQILVPRRCKLSDSMFEKLVFLRQLTKAESVINE